VGVWSSLRVTLYCVLWLSLSGCAFSYVDQTGNRHVLGLVHAQLPAENGRPGGVVRLSSVGLSVVQSDIATEMTLGYSAATLVGVRENSCVAVDEAIAR